jgi:protoheme IX farnesyltransferase
MAGTVATRTHTQTLAADLAGLFKLPIATAASAGSIAGYLAASGRPDMLMLSTCWAVFLLSSGACALNNLQGIETDARSERTCGRALPAGRISLGTALACAAVLCGAGYIYLAVLSWEALASGITAMILYNVLYTPLKEKTRAALIPGVMCGVMPPIIGWFASEGTGSSVVIVYLVLLFGLWQFPHFWLIGLRWAGDFARGGIVSMTPALKGEELKLLISRATLLLSVLMASATMLGIIANSQVGLIALTNSIVMTLYFVFRFRAAKADPARAFLVLNAGFFIHLGCFIADRVIA